MISTFGVECGLSNFGLSVLLISLCNMPKIKTNTIVKCLSNMGLCMSFRYDLHRSMSKKARGPETTVKPV